jgi:hypothetical protein
MSIPILSQILDVVSKTLAFHTSVTYEIKAPEPFSQSVHEDLFKDIARISKTQYASDYDLHIDLSRTLKRLNDGHCVWINACYVHHFHPAYVTPSLMGLVSSQGL